jgi:hypothetical protein
MLKKLREWSDKVYYDDLRKSLSEQFISKGLLTGDAEWVENSRNAHVLIDAGQLCSRMSHEIAEGRLEYGLLIAFWRDWTELDASIRNLIKETDMTGWDTLIQGDLMLREAVVRVEGYCQRLAEGDPVLVSDLEDVVRSVQGVESWSELKRLVSKLTGKHFGKGRRFRDRQKHAAPLASVRRKGR